MKMFPRPRRFTIDAAGAQHSVRLAVLAAMTTRLWRYQRQTTMACISRQRSSAMSAYSIGWRVRAVSMGPVRQMQHLGVRPRLEQQP